ncbi:MAG: tRNA (N(6)-L-threonylcarbamoyladenosine(37)-C(2))-methylthiotransferase MtaB [Hyphomicrobiaceae bacterium]|nr:tRNA (N(6)-L-threonylcarbamoyladenosine(37)-C(2))-methylthiotransferase MtaB [Hyphomicrobiaceae bacterium]
MSEPEIITFGCRLNSYESEVMRAKLIEAGVGKAFVINSCAVTNEAVRQSRQTIRKLRREHPEARIIVTGCAAQIDPAPYDAMPEVDFVIGNGEKMQASTWQGLAAGELERVRVNDIFSVRETASHMISGFGGRARAYVQIQNGCDHRCTFCIIPFGRGNSRSVPAGDVVEQIARLSGQGFAEIVLTGVDITDYGVDLPGKMSLGKLCDKILALVPELARLRISSIDAIESDEALLELIAHEQRLMPHLHLSLQAGDPMILKRMKRRHSPQQAVDYCDKLRALRPDIVFGADFIAGFPTETDEMFENTLNHVEACGLTWLHVFPFSPREGTPAARMPQVNGVIVKERARRLRDKGRTRVEAYLKGQLGQETDVLVERDGFGRTPQFAPIRLDAPVRFDGKSVAGDIIRARITDIDEKNQLLGTCVQEENVS